MNRRGFSLTELIVVLVAGIILILAISIQFVTMVRLKIDMGDRVYVMREARVIMDYMTNTLRFAKPDNTLHFDNDLQEIHAQIRGGHTQLVESSGFYIYKRWVSNDANTSNKFCFAKEASPQTWQVIGKDVTFFDTDNSGGRLWDPDPAKRLLTLRFTVTKNNASIPVETTIKVMGEE